MEDTNQPLLKPGSQSYPVDKKRNILNVVQLGASFCVLFIGFNTAQSFEAKVNKNLGLSSLAVLYFFFSFSNLIAGAVVQKIGEKISLVIGAFGYVLYLAANLYPRYFTLLPAAAILGFGAATLWTAQGSYMAKSSTEDTRGLLSGVFFAMFQLNAVIGNLMAALVLYLGKDTGFLFFILFILGFIADISFLLLRNPSSSSSSIESKDNIKSDKKIDIYETIGLFKDKKMMIMIPILIYSGFSQSYFYSKFPQTMNQEDIGLVMAAFGLSDTIGSLVIGKLSDIIGKKPVIIFSTIIGAVGYVICWIIDLNKYSDNYNYIYLFFIVSISLGISDSGYNTQLYSIFGHFKPNNLESAYAFLKGIQSTASAIAYGYSLFWDLQTISWFVLIWLGISLISFFICDFFVHPLDPPKKDDKLINP